MGQSGEKLLGLAGWMPGDPVLHDRGGRLFEAGRLLTFSTFRVGAYSRWVLIRGWALIRSWALNNFYYLQCGRLFEVGRLNE